MAMRRKPTDRRGEGERVTRALDDLKASDPEAFPIALALAQDVIAAFAEGSDLGGNGFGNFLYGKASKSLQKRALRMFEKIQPILETFMRPDPPPAHRRSPTPRRGKTGRRRR